MTTTPIISIPKVERVEVHSVRPEAADLRKIRHYAATRGVSLPEVTLLYRVYSDGNPEPSGRAIELFIGDYQVRKYSQFKGGLFFTVNDPELAKRLAGGAIKLRVEGSDEMSDSGVTVPPFEPLQVLFTEDADGRAHRAAMPSQAELLWA
jgi:hypothetical protein